MKSCPDCGKQIDEFCGFCPYCMSRLTQVRVIQRTTKKAGAGRRKLTATVLLLIAVAVCLALPLLNYSPQEEIAPSPAVIQMSEEPVLSSEPAQTTQEPPSQPSEGMLPEPKAEPFKAAEETEKLPEPSPSTSPEPVTISKAPVISSPSPSPAVQPSTTVPEQPEESAVVLSVEPSPEPAVISEPPMQSEEPVVSGNVSLIVWGKEMKPGAVFGSGESFYTEITVLFNGEPTADFMLEAEYPDKVDWTKSDDGKLLIKDADGIVRCPFTVTCFGVSANYIWDSIGPDNPMTDELDKMKLKFLEFTVLPTAGFGGGGLETYYITVMMGDEVVTDFTAYVDDPSVCTVGKSNDGRMTITNVNGGITKLYVTVGDITEMFEWNGGNALGAESRRITVELYGKTVPAGGGFGTDLLGEHGVTVMLDGQIISDYTFEIADTSVCTAYKAEDGKLMVTNVKGGETKLIINSDQKNAEFIWFCGNAQ